MKKQFAHILVVLFIGGVVFAPSTIEAKKRSGGGPMKQKVPKPDTVESVDAAAFSFKVATGQTDRRTDEYTITGFTKVFVNNKPAKLEEVKKGMRVTVVSTDGKTASRIEAHDYAGSATADKKDPKKDKKKK